MPSRPGPGGERLRSALAPPTGLLLATLLLLLARCAGSQPAPGVPGGVAAPSAPNESRVTAEVLDASVVDSSTLGIAPAQPLCVLTLKLLSVRPVGDLLNVLDGRSGETIRALSKDPSLAGLTGQTVSLHVSRRGDERSRAYWIVGHPTVPGGSR